MNARNPLIASALLAASLITGTAHAALEGRDLNGSIDSFEAYYDTDLDITWLARANVNGRQTWAEANTWAANLRFTDVINHITYDNWRLPTTLQPDASCGNQSLWASSGPRCTGSEMGHLFYSELGGTVGQSILTTHNSNYYLFTNFQSGGVYRSATEYAPDTNRAWTFDFSLGYQNAYGKSSVFYALAVSPGDVGIAAVPEPETYAMMLAGLGMLGFMARRRKNATPSSRWLGILA